MTHRFDDFNRADSTTALGTASDWIDAWTASAGSTWGINSNQGYMVTSTGQAFAWLESNIADVYVEVVMGSAVGTDMGVVARVTTAPQYILGAWTNGTGFRAFSLSGGSFVQIGTTASGSLASGDVLRLTCNGTSITWSKNGTPQCSGTSPVGTTNTKVGLRAHNDTAVRFNSFDANAPSAGGITGPLVGAGHLINEGPLVGGRLVR